MENHTTNSSNSSNPPYILWIREPNQRTTFGIFSFCFSTLIICVWSALHFPIPTTRATATRRVFFRASWMVFALLAPEILLYFAIVERINAGRLLKRVLKLQPDLAEPRMLARMYNYFCGRGKLKDTSQPHFSLVHAFYAVMGGFAFYEPYGDESLNVEESLFEISRYPFHGVRVLDGESLIYVMEHFPRIITDITEESILDRTESSSLSKALLIFQVGWFCTNCASRLNQGLPLSLLEVSTAAHAFCTLLTYFVWWSKPCNVAAPTLMREKGARAVHALLTCSRPEYLEALEMAKQKKRAGDSSTPTGTHRSEKIILAANALQHLPQTPKKQPQIGVYGEWYSWAFPGSLRVGDQGYYESVIIAVCPILYGAIHFLARGNQFPTTLEAHLWRVSAFVVTFSGLVGITLGWFIYWHDDEGPGCFPPLFALILWWFSVFIIPIIHMLASGFLIVESFRQLFFLDSAAHQLPSWSNYWPHFS